MKLSLKIAALCLMALIAAMPAWGRRAPGDKVGASIDGIVYDFGTVHQTDQTVTHDFTVTNTGTSSLAIIWIKANCGCTVPSYSRKPLRPGEKTDIKVEFKLAGQRGEVDKDVRVRFKNGKGTTEEVSLRLVGVVVP